MCKAVPTMEPAGRGANGRSPQGSSPPRHGHCATAATTSGGGASGPEVGSGTCTACGPAAAAAEAAAIDTPLLRLLSFLGAHLTPRSGVARETARAGLAAELDFGKDARGTASAWTAPPQLLIGKSH